jgi:hypothetical protein
MPCVVSTVHDPVTLAATCKLLGLAPPEAGSVLHDGQESYGWIVRLPGLRFPIVCDTLRGLVAYHPLDGAHDRFARLMRFVFCYYDVKARLRRKRGRARRECSQAQLKTG